jgi:hypothetical protein
VVSNAAACCIVHRIQCVQDRAGNAKHTLARGGVEAIESAHTVAIRLRIVEPKFTVEGLYQASRDGQMRIEVFADGKRVFSEGYDGRRGWQLAAGAEHADHHYSRGPDEP